MSQDADIAVLQVQQENTDEKLDELHEKVDALHLQVEVLSRQVEKRASFIAGVTTSVSIIWATVLGITYLIFKYRSGT